MGVNGLNRNTCANGTSMTSYSSTPPPTDENAFFICWEDRTNQTSHYAHNYLILEMTFVPVPEN